MNEQIKEYLKSHKVLTLEISKESLEKILKGKQKIVRKYVLPTDADKYVYQWETEYENGDVDLNVEALQYDALYLTCKHGENTYNALVRVRANEFVECVDENGKEIYYEYEGETYLQCQIWYHLGKILYTESV